MRWRPRHPRGHAGALVRGEAVPAQRRLPVGVALGVSAKEEATRSTLRPRGLRPDDEPNRRRRRRMGRETMAFFFLEAMTWTRRVNECESACERGRRLQVAERGLGGSFEQGETKRVGVYRPTAGRRASKIGNWTRQRMGGGERVSWWLGRGTWVRPRASATQ